MNSSYGFGPMGPLAVLGWGRSLLEMPKFRAGSLLGNHEVMMTRRKSA